MKSLLRAAGLIPLAAFCLLVGVGESRGLSAQDTQEASLPLADPVKTIAVNGVKLAYVERGQGEPVVLIHGFLHDYRLWSLQVPEFSKHLRVITYSMRHRWPDSPTGDASDLSDSVEIADLVALIERLELGPVHLVGHSGGAGLALRMARDHPELVRSIVLGEPGPFAFAVDRPTSGPAFPPEWIGAVREAYEKGQIERALGLVRDAVLGEEGPAQPPRPWVGQMLLDNAWQLKQMWTPGEPAPPVTCEEARRIEAPALLLGGDRSPAMFGHVLDGLQKCLPAAERAQLSNSSHGLELENPSGFNEVALRFLSRHSGDAKP